MAKVPYHFYTAQDLDYAPPPGVEPPPDTTSCHGVSLFLGGLANHQGNIEPQIPDLLNAAQIVGVYPGDDLLNSYEMSWREFSLKTTVSRLAGDYLGRTAVYELIHASEKGALSFQMGQVFSAVVAAETAFRAGPASLPGVFMHLDRWKRIHPAVQVAFRTNREPDFISEMGVNSFQVWESKCRNTHGVAWSVLRDGFSQAWSVAGVAGMAPEANVATLCRTDPTQGSRWEVYVADPAEPRAEPVAPEVQDGILRQYYEPFWGILKLLKARASSYVLGDASFLVVPRPGSDCYLGVDQRVIEILARDAEKRLPPGQLYTKILETLGDGFDNGDEPRRTFVNVNGILTVVGDSWFEL